MQKLLDSLRSSSNSGEFKISKSITVSMVEPFLHEEQRTLKQLCSISSDI